MRKKITMLFIILIVLAFVLLNFMNSKAKKQFFLVEINIKPSYNNYALVTNFQEFQEALKNHDIQIIEIANDLDLGYNKIKDLISIVDIECHNLPLVHPILINSGISKIKIRNRDGLIVYSKNGSKILHANIVIENSKNIMIDNLKMEELWEWDESTEGSYDQNNWDYITIKNCNNICIRNCEFSKSYDSITDIENSNNVTIEYCKVNSIDINSKFYNQQFQYLEDNIKDYPIYNFLRNEVNLSINEIKELVSYQYKVYTIGTQKENNNLNQNIIIHDNIYVNVKTRLPRLRNTKAYIYNIYVDSKNIANLQKNIKHNFKKIDEKYHKIVSLDSYGVISTEGSYALLENCIFDKTRIPYSIYSKNEKIGFISIIPRIKSSHKLKTHLEKVAGIRNEK